MTYPLSTTGFARALAQASTAILKHGINRPTPTLEQRWLSTPRGSAKSANPASDGPILSAVIFSGKTFAAALLALFISFWLGLDEPYWALLTVFVVAQPDSGLVLAKRFYRLLGTAAGILVATALVLALAQYGELFFASLAGS